MFDKAKFSQLLGSSADEYRKILQAQPDNSQPFCLSNGFTPFHQLIHQDWFKKMEILFHEANRLGINPNSQFELMYHDTPLHLYIANELKDHVEAFLKFASRYNHQMDLNLPDDEGKTSFFLAIKMGNFPLELLERLITTENYNKPDNKGITPIMIACAMRRIDIIQLILKYAYKHETQSDDQLDFDKLSPPQKDFLKKFINEQIDPVTGKTLGHFAVMRHGTDQELSEKSRDYQLTVSGICKSVGIDSRRDENAQRNSPLNDLGGPIILSSEEVTFLRAVQQEYVFTQLTFRGNDTVLNAVLASQKNRLVLDSKLLGDHSECYKNLHLQIESYSGISYGEAILSRTKETIDFLIALGFDLAARQKNDKTTCQYIEMLADPKYSQSITSGDRTYLFPLIALLNRPTECDITEHLCGLYL